MGGKKSIIAGGILLAAALPAFGGIIAPGDCISEETLTVPNGAAVITEAGEYRIRNSTGTLSLTNGGTSMSPFRITGGDEVTVSGSIAVKGTGLYNGGTQLSGGSITVRGNVTYDVDNSGAEIGSGNLFNIGSSGSTAETTLSITGNLSMKNVIGSASGSMSLITAFGTNTTVNIGCSLYLYNAMTEEVTGETSGANVLYANSGATVNVAGNAELYGISSNPDAVTAKRSSTINLNGAQNRIVGNISFIDTLGGFRLADGGTLKAVFDGPDSFWWGDEQNYCRFWKESFLGSMTQLQNYGTLDFTFKNGAEWIYFGDDCYYELTRRIFGFTLTFTAPVARAKYVSALTLENGGIVNLQDADIQQKLTSVPGLLTVYPKLKEIKHDFVTIGDLKGSGGIFKLDLNPSDKSQSDMIYIESSSSPGQHFIEGSLTADDLASLSPENTLRFATTAAAASGVSFSYLLPQYDDSLYLYTPLVGSSAYVSGDAENEIYNARYGGSGNYGDSEGDSIFTNLIPSLDQTYENGLNWFLCGCEIKVDPVVPRLAGAAVGTYDFALDMDRLDKRQGQAQYLSGKDDGFWVRFSRGSTERSSAAKGTSTMGQFGYDRLLGSHRVGAALDYKKGSSRTDDSMALSENKRREAMIYDTWTFRSGAYLDLTARFGKIDSDVRAYRDDGRELTGSYDTHASAVGIEFGMPFRWGGGWFLEPQVQFQYAWLNAENYRTSNGYDVALDRAESAVGRFGFRFGVDFGTKNTAYIKADVMHEFSGGQNVTLSGRGSSLSYAVEKRGTWYDLGFGADWQIGRNSSMFIDVEKVFGDHVKGWELNAGLSLTW